MGIPSIRSLLGDELFCELVEREKKTKEIVVDRRLKEFDKLRITASSPIPAPIPILSIGECQISTPGNLTVISGESKSGKTSFCNVVLSGTMQGPGIEYDGFEGLNITPNVDGKAVLHIDTEQSMHHQWRNLQRGILRRVGLNSEPDWFRSYSFRQLDLKEFEKTFMGLLENLSKKFNGVHLIVIDGIADFIKNVNDEEESNKIVRFFEIQAEKYKTPIIVIIHFNPSSNKQRGHLGSQLQRKAESVLAIKKEKEVSHISPQYLRNGGNSDVQLIQFMYDKLKGYFSYCGVKEKKVEVNDKEALLIGLTKQVFNSSPITHSEAVERLMTITDQGKSTIKNKIALMVEGGLITKEPNGKYSLASKDLPFQ